MSLFAAPTWFTIVPNGLFPVVTVTARFYNHTIPIVGEVLGMDTPLRSIDREACRRLMDMLLTACSA